MKQRAKQGKRYLAFVLVAVLVIASLMPTTTTYAGYNVRSIYVDASNGDDSNDGLTKETPWKTLAKVNSSDYNPGDIIYLKAGEVWEDEHLAPTGSGMDGQVITIDRYGEGDNPVINTNGTFHSGVYLENQEYWEIKHLEVSNKNPGNIPDALGDYRGIYITINDPQQEVYSHYRLDDVYVHDVTGEICWIGGSSADSPGIKFKTGWDKSKRTGGIIFDVTTDKTDSADVVQSHFDDVIVENSEVHNTSFAGITFKQLSGPDNAGGGVRDDANTPEWNPHTNITVRNNYITQQDTDYGCNAIYFTDVRGGLIENNVVDQAGTSGIELYYTDQVTVQYNEVFGTTRKAGGADYNGIDPDKATTQTIVQYNYVHDNGDGILLCQFIFGDSIIRNNVLVNNARHYVNLHADKGPHYIYNNTFINTDPNNRSFTFADSSAGSTSKSMRPLYDFKNNIFYTVDTNHSPNIVSGEGVATSEDQGVHYDNNVYYGEGVYVPTQSGEVIDTNAIVADPLFNDVMAQLTSGTAGTGPQIQALLVAYGLQSGSPAINSGVSISGAGSHDIVDQSLYNGAEDIGAIEYYGALDGTESVTGLVTDTFGVPIEGVDIDVHVDQNSYVGTTDSRGYYHVDNVPEGTYDVTATKDNYLEDTASGVSVVDGNNTSDINLTIESLVSTGKVEGTVVDQYGNKVNGAHVQITDGNASFGAETGSSGYYIITDIDAGNNYNVQYSKEGYMDAELTGIQVQAGQVVELEDVILIQEMIPEYKMIEDFESLSLGDMSGDGWTGSYKDGNVDHAEVISDPQQADNQIFFIHKDKKEKYDPAAALTIDSLNMTGIITLEARVMSNTNTFFGLPYIKSGGTYIISSAFDGGHINVRNGSSTVAIGDYAADTWYDLKFVINMTTHTFDVYLDGQLKGDDFNFRGAGDTLTSIHFYSDSSASAGDVYLDDIRIVQGFAYEKNDTSLRKLTTSEGNLQKLDDTHYSMNVLSAVETLSIETEATSIFAETQVNGKAVDSNGVSETIQLADGVNTIPVVVTAEDGTTKTYTVTVNRLSGTTDTFLSDLTVSSGQLSPAFASDVNQYTLALGKDVDSLVVTPTLSSSQSAVTVNNTAVTSGDGYTITGIAAGQSTITVQVTSTDSATNDYVITVTKEASQNPGTGGGGNNGGNGGNSGSGGGSRNDDRDEEEDEDMTVVIDREKQTAEVDITEAMIRNMEKKDNTMLQVPIKTDDHMKGYVVHLPKAIFESEDYEDIELQSDIGSIILPKQMVEDSIFEQSNSIDLVIDEEESEALTDEEKEVIGDHPVLNIRLEQNGHEIPWKSINNKVMIRIPYVLDTAKESNPEQLSVVYLNPNGEIETIRHAYYDSDTEEIVFETGHFSRYAVVYKNMTFTDVDQVPWALDALQSLYAKGIVTGYENQYKPMDDISRGEFITLLMRAVDLTGTSTTSFNDIQPSDYYYDAVVTAETYGIVQGKEDGRFDPDASVTREEMMVMSDRLLTFITGEALDKEDILNLYDDHEAISDFATASIARLVDRGLIQGDNGRIHPQGLTTRAEAAVVIYRLYDWLIVE